MNKLLRSAALISCLVAGSAHAVGLGEARLLSRYGQPLLIEVPLYHDGALDDLVVNIANGATYTSMGLDKNGELHLAQVQKIVREKDRKSTRLNSSHT